MTCDYCHEPFEPRTSGGSPQHYCSGGRCREAFHAEARRKGAKALRRRKEPPVDFEEARQDPEFQKKVAEILAWAEAQHPATPEAWGIEIAVVEQAGDETPAQIPDGGIFELEAI